jgi:cell division septum initiation protein DivIVA
MDILYLVDRLENLIAGSRKMPLVNQILIKEGDILNIVDQMRTSIPDEIKQARRIIQEKERILAQAQADATTLLTRAREETERAMNREGLLQAAEARSHELVRQAEEQAHTVIEKAEEHSELLKSDADNYVAETLSNLKDHLASIEMDISRSIISIEKGLESLDLPEEEEVEFESEEEIEVYYEDVNDPNELEEPPSSAPARPIPRRASLANDTQGGPVF